MGTSKSYPGPKWPDTSQAINDATPEDGAPSQEAVENAVRTFVSDLIRVNWGRAATGTASSAGANDATSGGGGGGSGGGGSVPSTHRASRSGSRLAKFIDTTNSEGLKAALRELNLEQYANEPVDKLRDALVNALVEPGGLLDDVALRDAMDRTIEELCSNAKDAAELEAILKGKADSIESVVAEFYANVLAVNFENKEFHRIRERVKDRAKVKELLRNARDYIRGFVTHTLPRKVDLKKFNLNGPQGRKVAEELNRRVWEVIRDDV
jgi:hypothetical protein